MKPLSVLIFFTVVQKALIQTKKENATQQNKTQLEKQKARIIQRKCK